MVDSYDVDIRELKLCDPFGIARGTRRSVRNLFMRIDGGLGEGAPIYYRGQTVERMADLAREWLETNPRLDRPIETIMDDLCKRFPHETGFWQAVDLALHDAWGKREGKPLYELWGISPRDDIVSSFTIGMDDMETVMRKVEKAAPYPILKVKVGGERDLKIVRAIHEKTQKRLYVDANEGWTYEEAIQYLPVLRECGVVLIEQPLPGGDRDGYRKLREANETGIPIIMDESVHGPEDVASWVDLADGINIKLAKCGGLTRARRTIEIARDNRLLIMIGCMIESSLGITAAAHLAPLVDFVDLDGAALLANDLFEGMTLWDGVVRQSNGWGIGAVALDV